MSESPVPTPKSVVPVSNVKPLEKPVDVKEDPWPKAIKHLEDVKKSLEPYIGKHGYNPYMYDRQKIEPLVVRYKSGERSPELLKAFTDLKVEEPSLDKLSDIEPKGIIPPVVKSN